MQNDTQERILEAGDLRVRFFWHGDRFAHEVSVRREGVWQPALVSVEGTPHDDWPASPPFQSLHVENRDDGRTLALLVGMAGKSHWSASVEIDAKRGCVLFDVACRLRTSEGAQLGSSYRPCERSSGSVFVIIPGERFGPTRLEQAADRMVVLAEVPADDSPQTVRWDYLLRPA